MAGWTAPNNAVPGNPPSAVDYNAAMDDIRFLNNGQALGNTPYQNSGVDYSLSIATTWTSVDTTNLAVTKTIASTRFLVKAFFSLDLSPGTSDCCFDWYSVGLALRSQNNNTGVLRVVVGAAFAPVLGQVVEAVFTGLTPGANTFYLQYYKNSGTVNLRRNGYPTQIIGYEL